MKARFLVSANKWFNNIGDSTLASEIGQTEPFTYLTILWQWLPWTYTKLISEHTNIYKPLQVPLPRSVICKTHTHDHMHWVI